MPSSVATLQPCICMQSHLHYRLLEDGSTSYSFEDHHNCKVKDQALQFMSVDSPVKPSELPQGMRIPLLSSALMMLGGHHGCPGAGLRVIIICAVVPVCFVFLCGALFGSTCVAATLQLHSARQLPSYYCGTISNHLWATCGQCARPHHITSSASSSSSHVSPCEPGTG